MLRTFCQWKATIDQLNTNLEKRPPDPLPEVDILLENGGCGPGGGSKDQSEFFAETVNYH
jgi:hypothetical protein